MVARFIPEDEPLSIPVLSTETVYEGAIWNVVRDTFPYNDEILSRDYVDHTGAVAIVALNESDEVMMIRQYRHSIRTMNWEIPAGLLDIPGEDPLVCGKRELAEEADLEADHWEFLTTLNTTPVGRTSSSISMWQRVSAPSPTIMSAQVKKRTLKCALCLCVMRWKPQ